jgi:F0F1-type ATP synthase membrane subunit b/b'
LKDAEKDNNDLKKKSNELERQLEEARKLIKLL